MGVEHTETNTLQELKSYLEDKPSLFEWFEEIADELAYRLGC